MSSSSFMPNGTALSVAEAQTLWHMAFLAPLASRSRAIPLARSAFPGSSFAGVAAAYSAALVEAVGYSKAGEAAQRQLESLNGDHTPTTPVATEVDSHGWLAVFSDCVLEQADQLISSKVDAPDVLSHVLRATQLRYNAAKSSAGFHFSSTASPCDALFASLAAACLSRGAPTGPVVTSDGAMPLASATIPIFQAETSTTLASAAAPSATLGSGVGRSGAVWQLHRHWQEARLYGALTCATGITAPGPLARLLVAYAHAGDDRLRAAADDVLLSHLHNGTSAVTSFSSMAAPLPAETEARVPVSEGRTAEVAQARLSGVVAGVLEYALHIARTRSSATVAALNALQAAHSKPILEGEASSTTCYIGAAQSAALLLVQLTEESGYYQRTSSSSPSSTATNEASDGATALALAVVHAMQELLFTIVLGGATQGMSNRPEPVPAKKAAAASTGVAAPALLVSTRRGVSLPEADMIAQELFPALVQQLGVEWIWSPLLRHLSALDRQQQPASITLVNKTGNTLSPRAGSLVRWTSQALLDMVLLTLARKVYPQRLLNILPGSYERLLQNLDLLPPMPSNADDGSELPGAAAAAAATRATIFELPAYYAEPAAVLVSYFQRAGVSGLRLEEVAHMLVNATSSCTMLVRLRAQAPPALDAADDADDLEAQEREGATAKRRHTYALARKRVSHLISRYQGEVLLAAVVAYTQLRVPSQVQQLMRALALLFLKIHLDWRTHHDGGVAAWFLRPSEEGSTSSSSNGSDGSGTRGVRFSNEATVLLDQVGYEFYPLEWLPAVAAGVCSRTRTPSSSPSFHPCLPYSLCAAVGHQFGVQLRGTPLGGSGDATLRHPAGPRTPVVMPSGDTSALIHAPRNSSSKSSGEARSTAAAWQRTYRFLTGLMEVCYLDAKTSSTDLEGTMAVSSTRRVLTTNGGSTQGGGRGGGYGSVAAADIASQQLRSLLQQQPVMDALWGAMDQQQRGGPRSSNNNTRHANRAQKRPRESYADSATERHAAEGYLGAMRQLLLDYGAASFDATVEAADFALVVAQAFLPTTAGMCAAVATAQGERSAALLRSALEWSRGMVGMSASKARVSMLLQQQHQSSEANALMFAYNSATMDMAWLARRALRYVPQRILEKMETARAESRSLAQREAQWLSRLRSTSAGVADAKSAQHTAKDSASASTATGACWLDPLLMEQWTQCARLWDQLGLTEGMESSSRGDVGVLPSAPATPTSADEISCAQWLWYSPYFSEEWAV